MTTESQYAVDLRAILDVVRRRLWIPIVLVILAATAAFAFSSQQPDVYAATTQIRITNPNSGSVLTDQNIPVDITREINTQIELIRSPELVQQMRNALGAEAAEISGIAVNVVTQTDLVRITVEAHLPQVAQHAADQLAKVYVAQREAQIVGSLEQRAGEFRAEGDKLATEITGLDAQIFVDPESPNVEAWRNQRGVLEAQRQGYLQQASNFDLESAIRTANVEIVSVAQLPATPIAPRPLRDAALAAALAAVLGVVLMFVIERLDDRLRTPEALEDAVGAPLLGALPLEGRPARGLRRRNRRLPAKSRSLVPASSPNAEAYRTLAVSLRFSAYGKTTQTLVVTSSSGSEGKSTVTANLAVALADAGLRVVVISADLRRPVLAGIFGVPESGQGLTSVLLGDLALPDALVPIATPAGERLYLLPAGPLPQNPPQLLGSAAMGELLRRLDPTTVDFVLIDCPPVLPVSDPLAVAQFADGVLLVAVPQQTRSRQLHETADKLRQVGATIVGVVANGVTRSSERYGYGYGYGYEQHGDASSTRDQVPGVPPARPATVRTTGTATATAAATAPGSTDTAPTNGSGSTTPADVEGATPTASGSPHDG